jgi:hypothetical protein
MRKHLQKFEGEVSGWPNISTHPHRFGGREFRFGGAEVGHFHSNGSVDIPLPRALRDELLAVGLAEEHRWVPDSGWITFLIRSGDDVPHAVWLMRLSYLRYALKRSPDAGELLEREAEQLDLAPRFKTLLERFVRPVPSAYVQSC